MPGRPFRKEEVAIVPDEFVSGSVLMALEAEFRRTHTCPTGIEFLLDHWKHGTLRMAGVYETDAIFHHARHADENYEWHSKTFAKPGAPWSIFYAVVVSDVGWISPAVDGVCARWIRNCLDPEERLAWYGKAVQTARSGGEKQIGLAARNN
jgi:hypothetical protein